MLNQRKFSGNLILVPTIKKVPLAKVQGMLKTPLVWLWIRWLLGRKVLKVKGI
jgi:hypothetical protein